MAKWRYEMQTGIPRDFDPEIEGNTIDSIMKCCDNARGWQIPFTNNLTSIIFDTKAITDTFILRNT